MWIQQKLIDQTGTLVAFTIVLVVVVVVVANQKKKKRKGNQLLFLYSDVIVQCLCVCDIVYWETQSSSSYFHGSWFVLYPLERGQCEARVNEKKKNNERNGTKKPPESNHHHHLYIILVRHQSIEAKNFDDSILHSSS